MLDCVLRTAPTTCRDGWLGFLFRWRTQQSAISGINCRIIQLPNLWTQKAHGRSSLRVIPVHAASQCRTKNLLRPDSSFGVGLVLEKRTRALDVGWTITKPIRVGAIFHFPSAFSLTSRFGVDAPGKPKTKTKPKQRFRFPFLFSHEIRSQTWVWQDYPPNLSILLSGGKENNRDSLSQRRAKRDRTRCRIGS